MVPRGEQLFRDRSDWFLSTLVPPALIHSQQQRGRTLTWKKGPLVQKEKQKWQKMGNIMESMVIMPCFISIACMYVFFRKFERQPLEFEKACHLFWVKLELRWERFTGKRQACVCVEPASCGCCVDYTGVSVCVRSLGFHDLCLSALEQCFTNCMFFLNDL